MFELRRKKDVAGLRIFLWTICLILCMIAGKLQVYAAPEGEPAETAQGVVNGVPEVVAESAILMDAESGAILYSKDCHAKRYPASITKMMTALVAIENSEMTEIVSFSHDAVFGIPRDSSNIGIDEGESLSMQGCLYAMLLESANEVATAIAEHVGGSVDGFAEMMNEKAKSLGCTGTHFANANGLHDENHYVTAYDMGLIAGAFFRNEKLSEISGTVYYHLPATMYQPDEIHLQNHNRMLMGCRYGSRYSYEYTVGGKTGYTVDAGNTLVTCAEKDGKRLVCVVLKDEGKNTYKDSTALFEYGFAHFEKKNPLELFDEEEIKACIQKDMGDGRYALLPEHATLYEKEDGAKLILKGELINPEQDMEKGANARILVLDGKEIRGVIPVYYESEMKPSVEEKETVQPVEEKRDENIRESSVNAVDLREDTGYSVLDMFLVGILVLLVIMALTFCGIYAYGRYKQEKQRKQRRAKMLEMRRKRREEEAKETAAKEAE